jgi:predicted DCC family thiol-disulfide oxidoreductase YuxK
MAGSGTLLYDADCGLCVATATWLEAHVPATRLGLLPLQDVASEPRIAELVEGRDLAESVHFVGADGVVVAGARAALAAGRLVPILGLYAVLADRPLGHQLLEPLYREIASHRRRIGRLLGLPLEGPLPTRARQGAADDSGAEGHSL